MLKNKIYLGIQGERREVFKANETPTTETHGARYSAVIGPFRTMRGAKFMQAHGANNPHCQNVAQAERLALKAKAVPEDFPVAVLGEHDKAEDRITCGTCHRSWDDSISTAWTPVPSGRCPFEYYH
jgi:hypothetical protein